MASGKTYVPIATQTLASAVATVTFSSIPQTYTDLVLICIGFDTGGETNIPTQFNGDTATNYSGTYLQGNGTAAVSGRISSTTSTQVGRIGASSSNLGTTVAHFMNYANTSTYKTIISRGGAGTVFEWVGLWRSTSAITSMSFTAGGTSFGIGTTFTLYGIAAA
jgi:hypothetical protein